MESVLDTITNPLTGRKVRLNSKKGIGILTNYLTQFQEGSQSGGAKSHHKGRSPHKNKAVSEEEFRKQQEEILRLSKELNTRVQMIEKEHLEPADEFARKANEKYSTAKELHHSAFESTVPKISKAIKHLRKTKTTDEDRCFRSISRGTCEPEYFFTHHSQDKDPDTNKCVYDPKTQYCTAQYDQWSSDDRGQIVRRMSSLDRHEDSDLYWSSDKDGNYRPFITHHNPKQMSEHTHGHIVH